MMLLLTNIPTNCQPTDHHTTPKSTQKAVNSTHVGLTKAGSIDGQSIWRPQQQMAVLHTIDLALPIPRSVNLQFFHNEEGLTRKPMKRRMHQHSHLQSAALISLVSLWLNLLQHLLLVCFAGIWEKRSRE